MESPTFSVIIPCYNQSHFLTETVQSVIDQNEDAEIIIVDDGSTDATPEVIKSFGERVRALRQPNQGTSVARNNGANLASGRFLMFLDSDDVLLPDALGAVKRTAEQHPDAGVLYGWVREVDEHLQLRWECKPRDFAADPVAGLTLVCQIICPGSACIAKEAFHAIGGFDTQISGAEDWDCWIRLAEAGVPFRKVDQFLINYRKHGASTTSSYFKMVAGITSVQKKHRRLTRRTHRFWVLRHLVTTLTRFMWWRLALRPHVRTALRSGDLTQAASLLKRAVTQDLRAVVFFGLEVWVLTAGLNLLWLVGYRPAFLEGLR